MFDTKVSKYEYEDDGHDNSFNFKINPKFIKVKLGVSIPNFFTNFSSGKTFFLWDCHALQGGSAAAAAYGGW